MGLMLGTSWDEFKMSAFAAEREAWQMIDAREGEGPLPNYHLAITAHGDQRRVELRFGARRVGLPAVLYLARTWQLLDQSVAGLEDVKRVQNFVVSTVKSRFGMDNIRVGVRSYARADLFALSNGIREDVPNARVQWYLEDATEVHHAFSEEATNSALAIAGDAKHCFAILEMGRRPDSTNLILFEEQYLPPPRQ